MQVSHAIQAIPASPTLAISAKAKELKAQGVDVISFSAGEPDFATPQAIVDAGINALRDGYHKYTPVTGLPALRAAIRGYYERKLSMTWSDAEIIASCGAKHSLYNMWLAILDEGDEVLVPTPAWVSYGTQIRIAGGTPTMVAGLAENGFVPTIDALEAAYTPRTKAILINNPSNPTGAFWDKAQLEELAQWIESKPGLIVVSDAIYDELVYDGLEYTELLSLAPGLRSRYILINGISKAFAMTGWRLGYTLGPAELVAGMSNLQSQSTSNPTAVTQVAAITALELGEEVIAPMRVSFQARRDLIFDGLSAIEGVHVVKPRGAFYAFPDLSAFIGKSFNGTKIDDDMALANYLLDEARIALVPGSAFDAPGFMRMSYATSEDLISEGLSRLANALGALS